MGDVFYRLTQSNTAELFDQRGVFFPKSFTLEGLVSVSIFG